MIPIPADKTNRSRQYSPLFRSYVPETIVPQAGPFYDYALKASLLYCMRSEYTSASTGSEEQPADLASHRQGPCIRKILSS
jgi:hypothetical protein